MRCYFHLVSDHDQILDDEGVEVSDLESARAQALMAVSELQHELGGIVDDWSGWHLRILSSEGRLLYSFPILKSPHSST
ncbi:DUF6894 family protein [Microvirga aerilata]